MKNSEKFLWTNHSQQKMRFYRLSESRIKRVVRHPARAEEGIAPDTIACMQPAGSKKRAEEIWAMYQTNQKKNKDKIIVISAWRYPGISPVGEPIPIPEDVLMELKEFMGDS